VPIILPELFRMVTVCWRGILLATQLNGEPIGAEKQSKAVDINVTSRPAASRTKITLRGHCAHCKASPQRERLGPSEPE
jgi:hypothetical protein